MSDRLETEVRQTLERVADSVDVPPPDVPTLLADAQGPARRGRHRRAWYVAAAVAVVVAAAVVVPTWVLGGLPGPEGAQPAEQAGLQGTDAGRACSLVEDLPTDVKAAIEDVSESDSFIQSRLLFRLRALGPLGRAAAQSGDRFSGLGELGHQVHRATVRLKLDELPGLLDQFRDECSDLGL